MASAEQFFAITDMIVQFLKIEVLPGLSILLLCILVMAAGFAYALVHYVIEKAGD